MDFKTLKFQILTGSVARRVVLRALMIASALSIIPLLHTLSGSDPGLLDSLSYQESDVSSALSRSYLLKNRVFKPIWNSLECEKSVNLTTAVVSELMSLRMLDYGAAALCVGEGSPSAVYVMRELGFVNACGVHRKSFSLNHRKSVYELEYGDDSFDFVLSGDLDKVSVPAMLVLEIERVLKPGGVGAVLVGPSGWNTNSLIKSATPISSLLKTSSVVHVDYVLELTLVVFKKRLESVGSYQHFSLPDDCQSITNNEPWMPFLEPIVQNRPVDYEETIAYLPNFIDMPSKKRLVYVEIGSGEGQKHNATTGLLIPSYPGDHDAFNVYFVDHNASALLSCVKKPGVTFIYYPGLAGEKASPHSVVDDSDPTIVEDDGFNFLEWFKETVQYADFVVLKMKAGEEELKFLTGLFQSGTICLVDELFLSCPDLNHSGGSPNGDCVDLLKSLRSSGVFVHHWWD